MPSSTKAVYNTPLMSDWTMTEFEVRQLAPEETREAASLHERELPHEFLTRFGTSFLARYYGAFAESPDAVALAAVDTRSGDLKGVLIATFDTRAHYSNLVRLHGATLARHAAFQALRHPSLARDLIKTRFLRYARGILRSLTRGSQRNENTSQDSPAERVGFLTYVAVDGEHRGRGIGGALLAAYERMAREAELDRMELVTTADDRGAGPFYLRVGWTYAGERVSRSGERYALYIRFLDD